jgi:hypothetical protein
MLSTRIGRKSNALISISVDMGPIRRRLHRRDRWLDQARALIAGETVAKAAERCEVTTAFQTWTLSRGAPANAVIATPPSQQSSAGRVMTCPSAAVMMAASSCGRTASMVAPAVACDDDRDLLR